jgi:hypothetical protein
LKRNSVNFFFFFLFLVSCTKDKLIITEKNNFCELQTDNPGGRTYESDSFIPFNCLSSHCGLLPLSNKNYWIYTDSAFYDGKFVSTRFDTLRYSTTWKSVSDNLVWWESSVFVGLPVILYANDSSIFEINDRFFSTGLKDVRKSFGLFSGDTLKYLTSFEDAAAEGKSVKLGSSLHSPAGTFSDLVYFEKFARNYRKDAIFFKPGLGVIKYIQTKATMGNLTLQLQQISTLVAYYIE